jgi:hypothetical protein
MRGPKVGEMRYSAAAWLAWTLWVLCVGLFAASHRNMLQTLRGKKTPREGAGQPPALLLDQGSLPGQLPVTRQDRLTEATAEEREALCRW